MRLQRIVLRPAADLAANGTVELHVPCSGARAVLLRFRATSADAPAALTAAEHAYEDTGWVTSGALIVETGDAIAAQALNTSTAVGGPSTTSVGRTRRFAGPADTGGYFAVPWFRVQLTGHATNVISGLYIEALILGESDPSVRA